MQTLNLAKIDAQGAQFRHVFLGARLGRSDRKFYINPADEPEILSSLYPGYENENLWGDHNLWLNYFRRDYATKVTSARLSEDSDYGIIVYQSFTGCFDILRRYGADILVFGASDLAQAVPPDELAKYFPDKKILICAAPTFTSDTADAALALIEKIYPAGRPKPQYILFGISRTMSYLGSPFYPALDATKQEQIKHYKQADFLGRYAYLNQSLRIPWTWNIIYPIRRDANHLPLVNRLNHPERWSILDLQISPEQLALHPGAFDEKRRQNKQESSIFMGVNEIGCRGMSRLPLLLGSLNERALKLGAKPVFFTTPTMGDELRQAPKCFMDIYDITMTALNSSHTLSVNQTMHGYGMTILDFAFRDSKRTGGLLTFDVAHTNKFGAEKFTKYLAQAMKAKFER